MIHSVLAVEHAKKMDMNAASDVGSVRVVLSLSLRTVIASGKACHEPVPAPLVIG